MTPSFVDSQGTRLAYEASGTGAGVPLVLLHGLGDGRRLWDGVVPALAAAHRVVTYDLRGHGDSDAPRDPAAYSMPIFIADLRALLDALGIVRAALVGFSLGGAVALHAALAEPSRTAAVAAINANAAGRDPAEEEAMRRAQAAGESGVATMSEREQRWVARLIERLPPGARLASVVGRSASIVPRAAAIACPVWLVASDRDPGFVRRSEALLPRLRAGRRMVIAGAGHGVMLEQPERLAAVLLEFAAAVSRAG